MDELSARVALALSVDYDGQPSGRVRDVPDGRIVRYYTTLGLVDRPIRYEGRVAIYSTRHLLQIVAIKRLQQTGRSLSEIQQTFVTLDERALERLAAVPADALQSVPAMRREKPASAVVPEAEESKKDATQDEAKDEQGEKRRERFWNAAPAEAVTDVRTKESEPSQRSSRSEAAKLTGTSEGRRAPLRGSAAPLTGVPISEAAVLLAQFTRELDEADLDAIRAAAAPLLAVLEKRGLL